MRQFETENRADDDIFLLSHTFFRSFFFLLISTNFIRAKIEAECESTNYNDLGR